MQNSLFEGHYPLQLAVIVFICYDGLVAPSAIGNESVQTVKELAIGR